MKGVKLVQLDVSHIDEILEIERDHFSSPWTRWMFEQEIPADPVPEGPGTHSVVATVNGRVAGYTVAWFIQDGVHLMNIAVARDFQRQGVGGILLGDLIDRATAAGKRLIVLEVRASNEGAQSFYRRFKFTVLGVRRGYYIDNGEDAILMVRRLPARAKGGQRESIREESD